MMKLSPSILSADFSNLGKAVEELERYGADMVHIDVMDGAFVPNISFGIPVIKSIRKCTKLTFDVHLMIEDPARYVEDFALAGADIITIHAEADKHLDRTVNYIKGLGVKAGIAINPATPVESIKHLIPIVDMVLVMSVNPGFGGQKYIQYCNEKIKEVKKISDAYNKSLMIQVDGGVDKNNIKEIVNCGANVIVAGSAVFKNNEIEKNIRGLKEGF
ncbi:MULTISPECIES: ribulose-phosphate 3-epimerase [Clostridium]|uniref:Ribulose-phosphate 3-epimerase n=1 Tax=Clostridium senegalense TaxID=1465809 RepID=A0A6M0H0Y5_9CLOT|nr:MULTISPECIES: ribulose-phosphate 3-epimerase [Clostridium]NEU03292.1 ribulose-phosphate 3-epimerase [Clostridium senegalense]